MGIEIWVGIGVFLIFAVPFSIWWFWCRSPDVTYDKEAAEKEKSEIVGEDGYSLEKHKRQQEAMQRDKRPRWPRQD